MSLCNTDIKSSFGKNFLYGTVLSDGRPPAGSVPGYELRRAVCMPYDLFPEQQLGNQQEVIDQVHQADGKHHVEGRPECEAETVTVSGNQPGHGGGEQHRARPDQDLRDIEDQVIAVLCHTVYIGLHKDNKSFDTTVHPS